MTAAELSQLELARPASLSALCALLNERHLAGQPSRLLAGGTDLMVSLVAEPLPEELPLIVDLSALAPLQGIGFEEGKLRIGAGVTYAALQRSELVASKAPLLVAMSREVGGVTIQARGTLGGNLGTASPAADGVLALAALDATVEVQSVRGTRRLRLDQLQLGYKQSGLAADEVIVAVDFQPPGELSEWMWRKIGARRAQAISKVALAAVAEIEDGALTRCGLALAAVAPTTALMPHCRGVLTGGRIEAIEAAQLDAAVEQDIAPIDDMRSTRGYRLHAAKVLVRAFARQLGAPL